MYGSYLGRAMGLYTPILGLVSFSLLWLAALLGLCFTIRVYWHVRATLARGNRWSIKAETSKRMSQLTSSGISGGDLSELENPSTRTKRSSCRLKRSSNSTKESSAGERIYRTMAVQVTLYLWLSNRLWDWEIFNPTWESQDSFLWVSWDRFFRPSMALTTFLFKLDPNTYSDETTTHRAILWAFRQIYYTHVATSRPTKAAIFNQQQEWQNKQTL
jgi:hypothetical protein